jgi:hypothetical protein
MTRAPFIVIDGKLYRWKDILELRRAQLATAGAAQASQLALFATLHDDRRPPAERTASGRYLQPGLFAALSGGDREQFGNIRGSAETTGVGDFGERPR